MDLRDSGILGFLLHTRNKKLYHLEIGQMDQKKIGHKHQPQSYSCTSKSPGQIFIVIALGIFLKIWWQIGYISLSMLAIYQPSILLANFCGKNTYEGHNNINLLPKWPSSLLAIYKITNYMVNIGQHTCNFAILNWYV